VISDAPPAIIEHEAEDEQILMLWVNRSSRAARDRESMGDAQVRSPSAAIATHHMKGLTMRR
jgi:hypothetical protein